MASNTNVIDPRVFSHRPTPVVSRWNCGESPEGWRMELGGFEIDSCLNFSGPCSAEYTPTVWSAFDATVLPTDKLGDH